MSSDAASSWALLAWFVLLALAEASVRHHDSRPSSDARLLTNFTLGAVGIGASSLVPLADVGSSLAARRLHTGPLPSAAWSWPLAFLLTLLGLTLVAYWTHRAMHVLPLLWRVHRVHHSDSAVDVSTGLRHHPLELLVVVPADALVILLLGAPVPAVVASDTILLAAALFGHADLSLPRRLDRALAWLIVTPRLHRFHHHPERRLHDSNYGDTFTLWDRLFGTFTDLPDRLPVGLDQQPGRPDALLDQILSPIHGA